MIRTSPGVFLEWPLVIFEFYRRSMFRFFRKPREHNDAAEAAGKPESTAPTEQKALPSSEGWLARLGKGLQKTKSGLLEVFTGTRLDDDLYDELESRLILADAGIQPTTAILELLRQQVKVHQTQSPQEVKTLLEAILTQWLEVLESPLKLDQDKPTVIMVTGVNGAGKTTTIGKLTHHLAAQGEKVLLAAADTFRAAAKEQLLTWADRNQVDIVSQADGDPAAVSFDAVSAGKARRADVVLIDTAGRLPTQLHLMDELKKIKRVIQKADAHAPHEVVLVLDGHMGQNALAQAKAFDQALGLSGLVLTKLDGTAKGGIVLALAHWNQERQAQKLPPIPVYFIGVGERLEDLQPFVAAEFAHALLS